MPKQLNVNLAFTADTSAAKQQIKSLEQDLKNLMSASGPTKDFKLTKELVQAKEAAGQLKLALQSATTSTGSLDLSKFDQAIKASGMSLAQYREKLSSLGPAGQQAFAKMAQSIIQAEVPLRKTNALLDNFKTTLMNTARWQLSSSMLHGFMGAIQSAYGYAQDLNSSLNNIRIVTGASVEEMSAFAESANKAAQALSTSTTSYTDAALIYYQQGIRDQEEIAGRTETTIKLANVSRQSAEEVSQQMTAIWNNFYDGSKSLEFYADAITALGATTASSSAEIAAGLEKFAAIADTVGLSYEYATAAMATITAQTRQSADTVGTGLRTLFSRLEGLKLGETLEDGVDLNKYSKALETVGVQVLDLNGEIRDMDSILDDLGDRWDELTQAQKIALAQTVGGVRQYTNLIALMDNWDKMQQNVITAQNAEGTLQEQADIYAESWEAAQKRVKAAAQALYSDLLDDKFFISLANGFAEILQAIDGFIDAIGGLKTILPGLGVLMTQIFGKQMAQSIDNILFNMTRNTQAMQQQIAAQKQEAYNEASIMFRGADTQMGKAQQAALQGQLDLSFQLQSVAKNLTAEEISRYQASIDTLSAIQDQVVALGQAADKAKEVERSQADALIDKAISNRGTRDAKDVWKQSEGDLDAFNKQVSAATSAQLSLAKLNDEYARLATSEGEGKQHIQGFSDEVDILKQRLQELQANFADDSDAVTMFSDLIKLAETDEAEFAKRVKEVVDSNELQHAAFLALDETMTNLGNKYKWTKEELLAYKTSVEQGVSSGLSFKEASERAAEGVEQLKQKLLEINGLINQTSTTGQVLVKSFQNISSITMGINAFVNAINAVRNPDLSDWQRFSSFIMGMSMGLPTVISGLKGMQTVLKGVTAQVIAQNAAESTNLITKGIYNVALALGIKLKTADQFVTQAEAVAKEGETAATIQATAAQMALNASLLPVAAIALGIVAAIGALIGVFVLLAKFAHEDELAVENASKAAEKMTTVASDANQKAQDLKSTIDSYDSCVEKLNQCTKGTQEWRDALKETGKAALEVIDQVGDFLSKDDYDKLLQDYREGKGLNEEILKAAQQQADTMATQADYAAAIAKYEASVASVNYKQQHLAGEMITQTKGTGLDADSDTTLSVVGIQENWEKLKNTLDADDLRQRLEDLGFDVSNLDDTTLNKWRQQISDMGDQAEKAAGQLALFTMTEIDTYLASQGKENAYNEAEKAYAQERQNEYTSEAHDAWLDKMTGDGINKWSGKDNEIYQEILQGMQAAGYDYDYATNPVRGNDTNRSFAFSDKQGNVIELNANQVSSILAAQEGMDHIITDLETAEEVMRNLEGESLEFAEHVMTGYHDGEINLAEYTKNFNFKDLEQLKDASKEDVLKYLDMTEDELNDVAALYGKTGDDLITALQSSFSDSYDEFDQIGEDLAKPLQDIYSNMISSMGDITLAEAQQIKSGLEKVFVDTKGNMNAVNTYASVMSKLGKDAPKFQEALDNIDWKNANIEDLTQLFEELGIEADFSAAELEQFLSVLKLRKPKTELSPEEQYKEVSGITNGLSTGDTISEGDYDTLKKYGIDVEEFFNRTADGEYMLMVSSEELQESLHATGAEFGGFSARISELKGQLSFLDTWQADNKNYDDYKGVQEANSEGFNTQLQAVNAFSTESGIDPEILAAINSGDLSPENLNALADGYKNLKNVLGDDQITDSIKNLRDEEKQLEEQTKTSKAAQDVNMENVQQYSKFLKEEADNLDWINDELADNEEAILGVAVAWEDAIEGIEKIQKEWKNWNKQGLQTPEVLGEMTDVLSDMFNMDVSNDFVTDHLEEIQRLAEGDMSAIDDLGMALAQNTMLQDIPIGFNQEEWNNQVESIFNDIDSFGLENIEVGAKIEDAPFYDGLETMFLNAQTAEEDINNVLGGIGYDPKVTMETVTIDSVQQSDSDGSYQITYTGLDGSVQTATVDENFANSHKQGDTITIPHIEGSTFTGRAKGAGHSGRTGGGGGGGGGGRRRGGGRRAERNRQAKKPTDQKERYHVLNNQLQDINAQLKKIDTAYDRAFGTAKIKLLDQQIAKQKQLVAKQKEYLAEVRKNYNLDKQNLASSGTKQFWSETDQKLKTVNASADYLGMGLQFDNNGTLLNYDELVAANVAAYNAAVDKFNKANTDDKKAKRAFEIASAQYEGFNELLKQYEETQDLLAQKEQEVIDAQNAVYDKLLEKTQLVVQLKIDVEEDSLNLLNFLLERLQDNAYAAAQKISYLGDKLTSTTKKIDAYKQGLVDIFNNHDLDGNSIINQMMAGTIKPDEVLRQVENTGNTFTENEAKAIRDYTTGILDQMAEAANLRKEAIGQIGTVMDANIKKLDKIADKINALKNMTASYKNLVDLTGREYLKITSAMYDEIEKTNVQLATQETNFARQRKDQAKAQYDHLKEQYESIKDTLSEERRVDWEQQLDEAKKYADEMTDNYYSTWENAIEAVTTRFESAMKNMAEDFSKIMAGAAGNLEGLQERFDLKEKIKETFVPEYEKMYQLTKLTRDAQKKIDESSNLKVKQELQRVQQKILDARNSEVQLSQYELDYLQRELDLKAAQLALEEASRVKSQVRMTRDSEGNYSYVYTADEQAVEEAEQEYSDKLYEMQRLNEEYIEELQSQLLGLEQDYIDAMQEAADIYGVGTTEYYEAIQNIQADYQEYFAALNEELNLALENQTEVSTLHAELYVQLTGDVYQANVDLITSWDETMLAALTGYESMAEYEQVWAEATREVYEAATNASVTWEEDLENVYDAAGIQIDNFTDKVITDLRDVESENSGLTTEIKTTMGEVSTSITGVIDSVIAWENQYTATVENMLTWNTKLVESFNSLLAAWSGVKAAAEKPADQSGSSSRGSGRRSGGSSRGRGRGRGRGSRGRGRGSGSGSRGGSGGSGSNARAIARQVVNRTVRDLTKIKNIITKKGGGCFDAGTKITMADGSVKNIENVMIGDFVLSYNINLQQFIAEKVTGTLIHYNTINMLDISLEDGSHLGITNTHPIYTTEGWVSEDILGSWREHNVHTHPIKIGQYIFGQHGLTKIKQINHRPDIANYTTYNLTVENTHAYIANGQLVHNMKSRFDTGGYTGDWSGKEGKIAILHSKELVLNQSDTENLLKTVGIIRSISQTIDLNALSSSGAFNNLIAPSTIGNASSLEQDVHITAEFPNVTDRNEILAAFDNVINLASQYANR